MNFFKNFIIILFVLLFCKVTFADNHDIDTTTENATTTVEKELEEEEVPLNDPFAGNEGTSTFTNIVDPESEELESDMSLYKFKLVGLISGTYESYISLVNASGEVITLTLFQYLGDIKFVDLSLTEAIFQKEDKTYMIIDFNNQIRETDDYYEY
tara:strand:- start:191 stop:655 length:465 start_codon:yes stop_codon:yes gene_type:complete